MRLPSATFRHLLPIAFLIIAVATSLLTYLNTRPLLLGDVEQRALIDIRTLMTQMQGALEILLRHDNVDGARSLIASLGASLEHDVALLTDAQGMIIAATELKRLGMQWKGPASQSENALVSRVHKTGGAEVELSTNGLTITGFISVCGANTNGLRPAACGLLMCKHSIETRKQEAVTALQRQALVQGLILIGLALIFWLIVHFFLTSRLERLIETARHFAAGRQERRVGLHGNDEVAQTGAAFDQLLDTIVRDQEQLRESEQRLRFMVEEMPIGAAYVEEGQSIFVNKKAEEILGFPTTRLTSLKQWFEVLYGERAEAVREVYERDRAAGFPKIREASVTRPDGDIRRLELAAVRRHNAEIWLLHDITERVTAEASLKASEAFATAVLDTAVDSIVTIDPAGSIQNINKATEHIFGFSREELLGQNVKVLMPQPYQDEHDGYLHNYLSTGERKIIGIGREVQGRHKNGAVFPIELSVSEITLDNERAFTGIIRDISARKQAEQQLQVSKEELQLTFQNAPMGIVTIATSGTLLSANRALGTMLERSDDTFAGLSMKDLIHPQDLPRNLELFQRAIEGELSRYSLETRFLKQDSTVVHGILHSGVVHDADGNPLHIVGQIEDRTEHLQAAEAEQAQRERFEHVARLSTMGEMASGIAHELNQPLSAIATYAEAAIRFLKSGQNLDDELPATLDKISSTAHRGGEVIRRLRRMVKKEDATRELVDINVLVDDVISLAQVDARMHNMAIQFTRAPNLPMVVADSVQIQQVLLNLIRNSVDAMTGIKCDDPGILIETSIQRSQVQVTVADRGPGIDQQTADRVFDPFFTTKESGIGIGLSICRSIMRAHDGELSFTSSPGEGTVFALTLPYGG